MAFSVTFATEPTEEYDDLARFHIDGSGCLHVVTPDRRMVFSPRAWTKVVEHADPREPSSHFV